MFAQRTVLMVLFVCVVLLAVGIALQATGVAFAPIQARAANASGVTVPYTGRLTNQVGSPVTDGAYDFVFTLYDAQTGGAPLWMETQFGVKVTAGDFVTALGSVNPILPAALEGGQRWLAIQVREPGAREYAVLTRRQQLSAGASAPQAAPAAGAACPHDHLGELWNANIGWSGAGLKIDNSSNGPSFWGVNTGGGNGLRGNATGSGLGVYGQNDSGSGAGVAGRSVSGNGVEGYSSASDKAGVYGKNESTNAGSAYGVRGDTASGDGSAAGVYGFASNGYGIGVYGYTLSPNGWAGFFGSPNGNGVNINVGAGKTGLVVSGGGTKSAAVPSVDGNRLLYTEESTEVWFTDYGFGKLHNGTVVIPIDPIFAQTINAQEPYHVFLQSYGDAELYVASRAATQFQVRLRAGDPNVEFSYRIVAKRLGNETRRLERAPWLDNDPSLILDAKPGAR